MNLSVIILTQNEQDNITMALDTVVPWAAATYVIDSFSTDRTVAIAKARGVRVFTHRFTHWAEQRNWALDNLPTSTDWVFFLDADERVPQETRQEIAATIASCGPEVAGLRVRFDYRFLGRSIRRSFDSHAVVRIVRHRRARWSAEGAREYCSTDGEVMDLGCPVVHEDQKGLSRWIEKQRCNAVREALEMIEAERDGRDASRSPPERRIRAWLRRHVYRRMPLFVRPFAYFLYRYIFRLAFLEGRAGFVYAVLHGFWYHFLVDAVYYEQRRLEALPSGADVENRISGEKARVFHDAPAS